MNEYEVGQWVELEEPYRGYRNCEIAAKNHYQYEVVFSSGMTKSVYPDEIRGLL